MAVKLIIIYFIMMIFGTSINSCSGSAIPMWEFLSRSEKMSHLYTTFAKQVSDYCKGNDDARLQSVAHCKRDLLTYGLERLQSFPDVRLDIMDPYQRGANDLIWEMIMKGHPIVRTSLQQNSQLPLSSLSSAIILGNTGLTSNNNNYQKNPLFDSKDDDDLAPSSSYAMDMDTEYDYSNNRRQYQKPIEILYKNPNNNNNNEQTKNINNNNNADNFRNEFSSLSSIATSLRNDYNNDHHQKPQQQPITYLTGPMVVRVRPDGTPVEEDQNKPLPNDDDREIMQYGQIKLPNSQQISEIFNNHQNHYLNNNYKNLENFKENNHSKNQ